MIGSMKSKAGIVNQNEAWKAKRPTRPIMIPKKKNQIAR